MLIQTSTPLPPPPGTERITQGIYSLEKSPIIVILMSRKRWGFKQNEKQKEEMG